MQMLGSGYWSTAEVFQHVNLCGQAGAPWLSIHSRSKCKVQSHPHLAGFHVASICPLGFPAGSVGTESAWNSGDTRDACSIPGWGRSLEEEMATHSSILAWKISWTEEPSGLQSMGLQRVGHDWATKCASVHWPDWTACLQRCLLWQNRSVENK